MRLKDLTKIESWNYVPLTIKKTVQAELSLKEDISCPLIPHWDEYWESEKDFSALAAVNNSSPLMNINDELVVDFSHKTHQVIIAPANKKSTLIIPSQDAKNFGNKRLDILVEENSELLVIHPSILEFELPQLMHLHFYVQKQAQVEYVGVNMGGVQRLNLRAYMQGENSNFNLRHLGENRKTEQNHLFVAMEHESPRSTSYQLIRTLQENKSLFSCDNIVHIPKNITDCEAHQTINSLLLSGSPKSMTKPTMLIYNEQVQASHGNTIGSRDPEMLFYLLSRGMDLDSARKTLMRAFAHEVFMNLPYHKVLKSLETQVLERL